MPVHSAVYFNTTVYVSLNTIPIRLFCPIIHLERQLYFSTANFGQCCELYIN